MKLVTDDGTEIPLEGVRVLNAQPGDRIVLRLQAHLTDTQYERIRRAGMHAFGDDVQVVVLTDGIDIDVVRRGDDR